MIQGKSDHLIRNPGTEILSCTITSVQEDGIAKVEYSKFKQALFDISTIVFYKHGDHLYYPISMEFRLIDNNILYLTDELGLTSIKEVFDILVSSMLKEEKWSNVFKLVIIHTRNEPKYCHKLPNTFVIGDMSDYMEIYE